MISARCDIQFNAKAYVVEPAYRDDGLGLWDFATPPDAATEDLEAPVEAVRIERRDAAESPDRHCPDRHRPDRDRPDRDRDEPEPSRDAVGYARGVTDAEHGTAVATYPEWDRAAGIERADWTTIRNVPPNYGSAAAIEAALDREVALRRRVLRRPRVCFAARRSQLWHRLCRRPKGCSRPLSPPVRRRIPSVLAAMRRDHVGDLVGPDHCLLVASLTGEEIDSRRAASDLGN
jgi:hypothetical protein